MKIANLYKNCKHPRRNYTPKCENCKLIWKLQTDIKIANWYENSKAILMFWCKVPTWTCAIFIWDTAGMKTCCGTECFGSIAVWMTKTQWNNILQNLWWWAVCQNTITNKNNSSVDRTVVTWHHQDLNAGNLGTAFLLGQSYFTNACLLVMCVLSHINKIWNHVFYIITNYG